MNDLKVLIVDDDAITRKLLQKRLSKEGCRTELAKDGVQAVNLIATTSYDVVLTDLMMPGGVDGIGVLEAAKEANFKTEVILITAHGSIDNAIEAMKKGAADYLQKPINMEELLIRLQKIHNLKSLLKNASDLREAMQVTEQASSETIQNLEITVSELENRLEQILSILGNHNVPAEQRIQKALAC